MQATAEYCWESYGDWRLVIQPKLWNSELRDLLIELVERQPWAKHPQTLHFPVSWDGNKIECFLKILHPRRGPAKWKNWTSNSKALRAWRQGVALMEAGFNAPITVAAGERRRFGELQRSFILSRSIEGQGVPLFLNDLFHTDKNKQKLMIKRAGLLQFAEIVRRFHKTGFVHGDLVATNIFVHRPSGARMAFTFMDNDRTRCYPRWVPQSMWKRNLTQLNRLPLPGITLQDRMRFLRAYLDEPKLSAKGRKLARWFEHETRQRRVECDGVSAMGSFRKLMRWPGEEGMAKSSGEAG